MPAHQVNTPEERLLRRRCIDANGCWIWTGYVKRPTAKKKYLPYGYIKMGSRKDNSCIAVQVQRVAASLWMGLDLKRSDIHVLHRCDNPRCFNPDHLFFGDNISNVADRQRKGRSRGGTSKDFVWKFSLTESRSNGENPAEEVWKIKAVLEAVK